MHTIGIDMSKNSFHAAFDEVTIRRFTNIEEGIAAFLAALGERASSPRRTLISVEATGVYHLLLCERLRSVGWDIRVINPLLTHRMAASSLRKLKTDPTDALLVRMRVMLKQQERAYMTRIRVAGRPYERR
jgi:transposase